MGFMNGLFEGKSGQSSMRRVISFLYALAGILAGGFCLYKGATDWKILAVAIGLPSLVSIVLLLFTTWGDLNNTIDAVKGNRTVTVTKEEKESK